MSKKRSNITESSAPDQRRSPEGPALTAAPAAREVIRDKRKKDTPSERPKPDLFPPQETERAEAVKYGQTDGVIMHPIPDDLANPKAAHVDWLGFSVLIAEGQGIPWLIVELGRVFGIHQVKRRRAGWNGYTESASLGDAGLMAWGGKHQRGTFHVELTGTGCKGISDWERVAAWGNALDARITRIDLAHDDFLANVCNIEQVQQWWKDGGFNSGGRTPKIKRAGDWDQLTDGRTVYIGTRGNKLLRAYEKGKQLGFPRSPWCRVELELKGKNRVIPWEAVERPGQYLAGAYPCLKFLSETQCKVKTSQKGGALSLYVMTQNAKRLSGKAVNVLMRVHGGDAEAVVAKLRREGTPKRLLPFNDALEAPGILDENP